MGHCVYCLAELPDDQLTVDHVIARSWFPEGTPSVEKWKVPACDPCNNRLSTDEKETLERMALCMDPQDPALSKIVESARRARDPKAAKSCRDAMHRFNRRETLRRSIVENMYPEHPGLIPAFQDNFAKGSTTGILMPRYALVNVVKKWIRGVHYCELGMLVPVNAEVSAFFVNDKAAHDAFKEIIQHGKRFQKGHGVEVIVCHAKERETAETLYAFNIWQNFRAYGSVTVMS